MNKTHADLPLSNALDQWYNKSMSACVVERPFGDPYWHGSSWSHTCSTIHSPMIDSNCLLMVGVNEIWRKSIWTDVSGWTFGTGNVSAIFNLGRVDFRDKLTAKHFEHNQHTSILFLWNSKRMICQLLHTTVLYHAVFYVQSSKKLRVRWTHRQPHKETDRQLECNA